MAKRYLTAKELRIKKTTRKMLLQVARDLENGKIKHRKHNVIRLRDERFDKPGTGKLFFNMNHWTWPAACGTIHCIGGFMEAKKWRGSDRDHDSLNNLFNAFDGGGSNPDPGAKRAVKAIRFFLRNGPKLNPWTQKRSEDYGL